MVCDQQFLPTSQYSVIVSCWGLIHSFSQIPVNIICRLAAQILLTKMNNNMTPLFIWLYLFNIHCYVCWYSEYTHCTRSKHNLDLFDYMYTTEYIFKKKANIWIHLSITYNHFQLFCRKNKHFIGNSCIKSNLKNIFWTLKIFYL